MGNGETPEITSVREAEKTIKNVTKDNNIDATEIKSTNNAVNFLKEKNNEKTDTKKNIEEISKRHKDEIKNAIVKYFDVQTVDDGQQRNNNKSEVNLSQKNLTTEQIDAYLNTITWINKDNGSEDRKIQTIRKALEEKKATKEKEKIKETEKTAQVKLQDILNVMSPEYSLADKLFGGDEIHKDAWNALFDDNNISQIIPATPESSNPNDKKLQNLIAIYAQTKETGNTISQIKLIKGGSSGAEYDENYIKVELSNGQKKDILFCKDTDYIHKKRGERFKNKPENEKLTIKQTITGKVTKDTEKTKNNTENININGNIITLKGDGKILVKGEDKDTDIPLTPPETTKKIGNTEYKITKKEDNNTLTYTFEIDQSIEKKILFKENNILESLIAVDEIGAHYAFQDCIKTPDNLKNLLEKGLLSKIHEFHQTKNIDDKITKENGYYNVITDYVIEQSTNMQDLSLLQVYLKNVNAENIKYLGTDTKTQVLNYTKLNNLTQKPDFPKTTEVGKEIIKNIEGIKSQLSVTGPQNIQEAIKQGASDIREKYGNVIVEVLSFIGGKGFAKKLLGKYYDQYKDQIDKKYEEKYSLSSEEKTQVKEITKDFDNTTLLDEDMSNDKKDGKYFQKKFDRGILASYSTELTTDDSYKLIDPTIVYKAIETYNKQDENKNDQKNWKSYLIKNAKGDFQINTSVDSNSRQDVVDMIFADQTTWDTVADANQQITGVIGEKAEDISRFDLGETGSETRQLYSINTMKDIAIALTSYAFAGSKKLDYVITETKLPEEARTDKEKKLQESGNDKIIKEKFTKNRKLLSGDTGIGKIADKKYGTFDYTNNFIYNKNAKDDQKEYQTNILTPFETILTDKDQYPLFIASLRNAAENDISLGLFTKNQIHLKNTLSMIDPVKYKDVIQKLATTDGDNNTNKAEANETDKTITITTRTGDIENGTIILSQDTDGKLEVKREEQKKATK